MIPNLFEIYKKIGKVDQDSYTVGRKSEFCSKEIFNFQKVSKMSSCILKIITF
jgi:predicted Zn-dependent protease